jgi:hypothetical protein
MRESHNEQIERWANFVRTNPYKWKKIHTKFINAIFEKNKEFIVKLKNTPNGKEKIKELYGL